MGRIVAIGGGTLKATEPLSKYALRLTAQERPKVLFIPTASRDDVKYINDFNEIFTALNCEVKVLELTKKEYTDQEIDALINWMDLVYVGSGNIIYMMNKWAEYDLSKKLKDVFNNDGAVLVGQGSGSICWFSCGYSNSSYKDGKTDWQYIWTDNLLDLHHTAVCPHYGEDDRANFDLRLLEKQIPGYGLEDHTAFVQVGSHTEFIGCVQNAKAFYLIYLNSQMLKKEIALKYIF
ncbi:MAG: Type 1 glutamine amidotransferase-like domain-containing protein [Firmicutes bacterium]|nr:Type 1 glutamine amidotransferase-like domain-containing protein [Bacillota bacterium]